MKLWTITKNAIRECFRYRIVYFIFAMAVLFILIGKGCNPGTVKGKGVFFDETSLFNFAAALAYHGIAFWSMITCGLLASQILVRDIDDGTVQLVLSRPLSTSSYLAGKLLAVFLVSVLNIIVLGALFFLMFSIESGTIPYRIFLGFAVLPLNILVLLLLNALFSLVLPRIVSPLVGFLAYVVSLWCSLPYNIEKLRMVWEPSKSIEILHRYLPGFGDIQFVGSEMIRAGSYPLQNALFAFGNAAAYCILLWVLLKLVYDTSKIQ